MTGVFLLNSSALLFKPGTVTSDLVFQDGFE